jgi:prepilin-type N-terminal cleavage/methylation domain-containing protein
MDSKNRVQNRQRGFSLLEMLLVVLIMGIVTGGIFSQMDAAQQRANAEQVKLDDLQQARDFVDQFFRDINQIGYPNIRMINVAGYTPGVLTGQQSNYTWANTYINDSHFAMGLVRIDKNEIRFEADTNGDGNVQSVVYMLNGSNTVACAKCLQRSQVDKVNGDPITGQATSWGTEVNDVQNDPIFTYYKADGTPIPITSLPLDYKTSQVNAQLLASVKTIQISLQVRNPSVKDLKTRLPLETNFEGLVSLNNCSMAAAYDSTVAPMGCQ